MDPANLIHHRITITNPIHLPCTVQSRIDGSRTSTDAVAVAVAQDVAHSERSIVRRSIKSHTVAHIDTVATTVVALDVAAVAVAVTNAAVSAPPDAESVVVIDTTDRPAVTIAVVHQDAATARSAEHTVQNLWHTAVGAITLHTHQCIIPTASTISTCIAATAAAAAAPPFQMSQNSTVAAPSILSSRQHTPQKGIFTSITSFPLSHLHLPPSSANP